MTITLVCLKRSCSLTKSLECGPRCATGWPTFVWNSWTFSINASQWTNRLTMSRDQLERARHFLFRFQSFDIQIGSLFPFRRLSYWRRKWRRDFFIFNASDSFLVVAFRLYFTWIDQERNADLAAPTGHRGRWESPFRNKRHRWKLDQSYSPSSNHPFPSWKADSVVLLGKWSNFNPKIPWSPLQGNDFTCQVCSSDKFRWTHHPIVSDPKGCS